MGIVLHPFFECGALQKSNIVYNHFAAVSVLSKARRDSAGIVLFLDIDAVFYELLHG